MVKANRTQVDDLGDSISAANVLTFPEDEPGARQEFAEEVDVNSIVTRYGVPMGNQGQYGEVDYDLDLHSAIAIRQEAADAWRRLPVWVRERYGSWDRLLSENPEKLAEIFKAQQKAPVEQAETPVEQLNPA